ncbi:MAG: flavodoxin family protein [Chlamydiota bacterium]
MKIIAINGSPRGKKSTTYRMVEEFLKGMREFGWKDQHILLSELNIHHCMGCFHCWKNQGTCIFTDDMKKIIPLDCDILLLASPLYYDNISGLLKNFLDRSVAQASPLIGKDANNESIHIKRRPRPKLLAISNCGYPENSHFDVLKILFRRMARNMESDLLGEIYLGQGPLLIINDPQLKRVIDNYKALLQTAGREIAQNLSFSADTKKKLEEPLIPIEKYVQAHNAFFSKQ